MATIDFIGNRDDPDYVYYNAMIVNNTVQTTQTTSDPSIIYQDTRDMPILRDSSNYEVSVEKFTLDGAVQNLPIFIPQIQTPVTNINNTVYTITFSWTDGVNYFQNTQTLKWTPEDLSSFAPAPPTGTETQTESPYYYMYTFQHWVNIINNSLTSAYNAVKTSAGAGFGGTVCPFFSYDPERKVFSVSQDVNTSVVAYGSDLPQPYGFPSSVGSSSVGAYLANEFSFVGFNTNFEALINNLTTTYYADAVAWGGGFFYPENVVKVTVDANLPNSSYFTSAGTDKSALTQNTGALVNPFTGILSPTATLYSITTEEKSSIESLWSPVQSFVITTTQIPIINEFVSNPLALGSANLGTSQSGGNAFSRILIETPLEVITENWFSYEPKTPTFSSLSPTHISLRTIDFRVFWRNRLTNSLTPVTLYNLGTASIRLLFQKKKK